MSQRLGFALSHRGNLLERNSLLLLAELNDSTSSPPAIGPQLPALQPPRHLLLHLCQSADPNTRSHLRDMIHICASCF
uniref:Uncharacterized protein n=1 Tax=Scleropages formosus TaxID=113540 RepID=A0A8C9R0Q0_SCLFO